MLREWLDLLIKEGPKYGYYPEPQKSFLVVHPDFLDEAETIFSDLHVKIVTGQRFLGGFIGSSEDIQQSWLASKLNKWTQSVKKLSDAAKLEPHAAFVALSKSIYTKCSE